MALVNIGTDPWVLEFEACDRLSREIMTQLNDKDREKAGTNSYHLLSSKIRARLKQFKGEVKDLQDKLKMASAVSTLTPDQLDSRKRQVEQLQCRFMQLDERFNKSTSGQVGSVTVDLRTTGWVDDDEEEPVRTEIPSTSNLNVSEMRQQQQLLLRDQERGLDTLSTIIARQKQIAMAVNTEVTDQNEILDDISAGMDTVHSEVRSETNMIRTISRKDNTCGYWVVILLLFIVILAVSFA